MTSRARSGRGSHPEPAAPIRRRTRHAAVPANAAAVAMAFTTESRRRLRREYLPKIRLVTRGLTTRDLWWRPNDNSNSIANLLLHLDGNVRQWILSGVGGEPDVRDRDAEFLAKSHANRQSLLARIGRTLVQADRVLARLGSAELAAVRTIQGYRVSGLQAVYHVVEHFSGHTGQIVYIAKMRLDRDLALYAHLNGPRRQPRRPTAALRRARFL